MAGERSSAARSPSSFALAFEAELLAAANGLQGSMGCSGVQTQAPGAHLPRAHLRCPGGAPRQARGDLPPWLRAQPRLLRGHCGTGRERQALRG